MCLIAYVPQGKTLPEANLVSAYAGNDDGIGIMSHAYGVEKFMGRKALKRARRHIRLLAEGNHSYAIHFRYATHGEVNLANCHPFKTPNGAAYVMHNGVMAKYGALAASHESDTAYFVRERLKDAPVEANEKYWHEVAADIGTGNKLCVLQYDGTFLIVNEDMGDWIDGIWYSQTYSLPGYGGKWAMYGNAKAYWEREDKWNAKQYLAGYDRDDDSFKRPYEVSSVEAALERKYGTNETPKHDPWEQWERAKQEDEALDAALREKLAEDPDYEGDISEDAQDGWYICKSCEGITSRVPCIYCGFNEDEVASPTEDDTDDTECLLPNWSMVPKVSAHK